jgi:hypothetical protein
LETEPKEKRESKNNVPEVFRLDVTTNAGRVNSQWFAWDATTTQVRPIVIIPLSMP